MLFFLNNLIYDVGYFEKMMNAMVMIDYDEHDRKESKLYDGLIKKI